MPPPKLPTFNGDGDVEGFANEVRRILKNWTVAPRWRGFCKVLLQRSVDCDEALQLLEITFPDQQDHAMLEAKIHALRSGPRGRGHPAICTPPTERWPDGIQRKGIEKRLHARSDEP